jgi:FkbM family methyltransferase
MDRFLDRLTAASSRASRRVARAAYSAIPFKQALFQPLRGKLPRSVFQHLHFRGDFDLPLGPGRSIRLRHYGYAIENRLYWWGPDAGWEPTTLAIWRTLSPHARGVIDVGANTGLFALVARRLSPHAAVVAVEPVARVFEKLVANVGLNDLDIVCVCEAISDTVGVGTFVDPDTEHLYTITIEKDRGEATAGTARRRSVTMTTVDALVERLGLAHVDLLKLDVESHEPESLAGARHTLEQLRPSLIVEIWNDDIGTAVDAILKPLGYAGYSIDEAGRRVTHRSRTVTTGTSNYLFVPEEARQVAESRLRSEAPFSLTVEG